MRSPRTALLVTVAVGVVAFVLVAAVRGGSVVFSLGVTNNAAVVTLDGGDRFCQRRISPPESGDFDRVQMTLGTFGRRGPRVAVSVEDEAGRVLARGVLEAGYPDIDRAPRHTVTLDHAVPTSEGMAVCFKNAGRQKVAWYGAGDAASVPTTAVLDNGDAPGVDVNLVFLGDRRSYLSRLDGILERARLFRAGPLLPGWAYLLVIVGFVGAAAAGLVAAVGSLRSDED
jgi:hypothetical protein